VVSLLSSRAEDADDVAALGQELIPCPSEDASFEPRLRAVLKRHVVERCIYGVDLDPLAVELCRLSLWIETMDRTLPFSFLDHKVKCGNALVGTWFDQFLHYPVMAWKNREGGDKNHSNGVHFAKEARGKALREFANGVLKSNLKDYLTGQLPIDPSLRAKEAAVVHAEALALLARLHDLPVQDAAERARIYRDELLSAPAYKSLKSAMDLWCACWFWPAEALEQAPLPSTFSNPSEETCTVSGEIAARLRFFHWELEFPDVFCTEGAGFDAVLGNPPWDIAKPSSKEFFSNIDPLYRTYEKQEALRQQTGYFANEGIERQWLDYNAAFRWQSNFMKYASCAFGNEVSADKKGKKSHDFGLGSGGRNSFVQSEMFHVRWANLRKRITGYADPAHPFQHQGSADINLYKAFLEIAHSLMRRDGRLGYIIPSGLYSDHGTAPLRRLFLDHCQWEWLFGFENREEIFAIHRSFKFNPIILQKGGSTSVIQTAFMRRKLEDWEGAEVHTTPYVREQVEKFSPRSKAILEIQTPTELETIQKIYGGSMLLGQDGDEGWGIKYEREFDMTNDSKLFPQRAKWEEQGYRPDEYSRWIKGEWKPIGDLWQELGIDASRLAEECRVSDELNSNATADLDRHSSTDQDPVHHAFNPDEVARFSGGLRCAPEPYNTLPVPRADIPAGIILSRAGDAWITEERIAEVEFTDHRGNPLIIKIGRGRSAVELPVRGPAIGLPLYEGRMIGQFDFSEKGWISGSGRSAVWQEIPPDKKVLVILSSLWVFEQPNSPDLRSTCRP
jgi:hypothetical protein